MPSPSSASPVSSQHTTLTGAAAASAAATAGVTTAAAAAASSSYPTACSSRGSPKLPRQHAQPGSGSSTSPNTRTGSRSSQKLQPLDQKLAHRIVEACVDQVFAAKAEPNMADGSFNPALSLQQATDYEAATEAADLDRRLERGLVSAMLAIHVHSFVSFVKWTFACTSESQVCTAPYSNCCSVHAADTHRSWLQLSARPPFDMLCTVVLCHADAGIAQWAAFHTHHRQACCVLTGSWGVSSSK